jgi:surfactin synthase thioesterase subunit
MSKSQEVEKHHLHQIKYPRGVTVNFRKLERNALLRILRFYGVVPKADLTDSELASLTAKEVHNDLRIRSCLEVTF